MPTTKQTQNCLDSMKSFFTNLEQKGKEWSAKQGEKKQNRKKKIIERRVEAFFSMVFEIIFFVLINTYYDDIEFLNSDFKKALVLINISMVIQIAISAARIIITAEWYRAITSILNNFFSLFVTFFILVLFPFDFSMYSRGELYATLARFFIILSIIGILIAIIVDYVKFAISLSRLLLRR